MAYPRENIISKQAVSAAGAAATVTFPAATGRWRIRNVVVGYSAAPTGGLLTITDAKSLNLQVPITAGGPVSLPALDLVADAAAATVTLAAGGGSVVAYVNAYATFEG